MCAISYRAGYTDRLDCLDHTVDPAYKRRRDVRDARQVFGSCWHNIAASEHAAARGVLAYLVETVKRGDSRYSHRVTVTRRPKRIVRKDSTFWNSM